MRYTLSDEDRAAIIDRLYDVALDPERYEALLDQWDAATIGTRREETFQAPHLFDDLEIREHFRRADAFLDRLDIKSETSAFDACLEPFSAVPALLLDKSGKILAANAKVESVHGFRAGTNVRNLPINIPDMEEFLRALARVFDTKSPNSSVVRVRGREPGKMTLVRLQRSKTEDGTDLAIVASNEVMWQEQTGDLMKQAFGLSSAEVDIVRALLECDSINDISERRGRSPATIKTQIKSILAKTETHSQAELVRLTLSIMDMAKSTDIDSSAPELVSVGFRALPSLPFKTIHTPEGRRTDYLIFGAKEGSPVLYMPLDYGLARWTARAEAMAERIGLKIIVPVRAGYGQSDPMPKALDYDSTFIDDTARILDHEGCRNCPIISMGSDSYYSALLANARPDLVSGIFACPGVLPVTRPEQYERMEKWYRFILAGAKYTPSLVPFMVKAGFLLAQRGGKHAFLHAVYGQCAGDVATFEDKEVYEALVTGSEIALSDTFSAHEAFSRQVLGGQSQDWSEAMNALKGRIPVTFFNGLEDPQVPVATLREYQQDFPWIEYREFENAGQLIFFQQWEVVLQTVLDHLGVSADQPA